MKTQLEPSKEVAKVTKQPPKHTESVDASKELEMRRFKARILWQSSPEKKSWRRLNFYLVGFALATTVATFIFQMISHPTKNSYDLPAISASIALLLTGILSGYISLFNRLIKRRQMTQRVAVEESEKDLKQAEDDLPSLNLVDIWGLTQKRLDYYHKIATVQAEQSFRNCQIASGAGFAVLLISAVFAVLSTTTSAAIAAGAIGVTGGALSGFLGRTFLQTKESASGHLRSYFDQPLSFSRILAAERLLDGLDEASITIAKLDMIRAIVQTPPNDSTHNEEPAERAR